MSDIETTAPEAPEAGGPDISALTRILNTLVPQKTVTVQDAIGNEYLLPGALPARRQIEVLRRLDVLKNAALEDPNVQALMATFRSAKITEDAEAGGAVSDIVDVIVKLAGDPDVLESLSSAFGYAHPVVIKRAGKALAEAEETEEVPTSASDIFPLEEIVAGLVPFFVRLLKRGAEALGAFQQASQTVTPAE